MIVMNIIIIVIIIMMMMMIIIIIIILLLIIILYQSTLKIRTKIVSREASPYYKPFRFSGRNKAKSIFKHSLPYSFPHGIIVFRVLLQLLSLFKGFDGSVLFINVMEISSRKPRCPISEKCSKRCNCIDVPNSW